MAEEQITLGYVGWSLSDYLSLSEVLKIAAVTAPDAFTTIVRIAGQLVGTRAS